MTAKWVPSRWMSLSQSERRVLRRIHAGQGLAETELPARHALKAAGLVYAQEDFGAWYLSPDGQDLIRSVMMYVGQPVGDDL